MEQTFKEKMEKKCPEITQLQQEQFEKYKDLLLEWKTYR